MIQDTSTHQKRSWVGTVITLSVLFLLGVFVWRVMYFAKQIRSGSTDLSELNYSQTLSTITKIASQPVSDETVDVFLKNRPTLGTIGSPITIVEFGDFGCPYSRTSSFILRSLALKYPNQFSLTYRDFPLTEIHPFAQKASEAAACAGDQQKFWEYHDKIYSNQESLEDASFVQFANQLNLDVPKFKGCFDSHKYANQIAEDFQAGMDAGVRGTPTFFINGNRIAGMIPQDILENVIISVSAQKK
jgi:protein-disulfide isomerase